MIQTITRLLLFVFLSLLLLSGCAQLDAFLAPEPLVVMDSTVGAYTVEYFDADCPFQVFEDEPVVCGTLIVPQDRTDLDGLYIELAVAVLESRNPGRNPDPVLYLEGGPGGSALVDPDSWLESSLRDDRQIILFDQRGTGYSWPNLSCPEVDEADDGDYLDAVAECRDRLLDLGADLTAYNSAASAADIEDLRQVLGQSLGFDEWNLLGISYGTRLALTVMRDFPDGVRSVVLDSVYPPNIDAYAQEAATSAAAITALLNGCAGDTACATAFPNLADRFYDLLDRLERQPIELDPDIEIGASELLDLLVDSLYDTDAIPTLPGLIHETAEGRYDRLSEFVLGEEEGFRHRPRQTDLPDDSQGMFFSVECREELAFSSLDRAEENISTYDEDLAVPLLDNVAQLFAACGLWGAGRAPAIEERPVISELPTLLLAGEYDPVTPPSWAKLTAEGLSNHFYVELPRGGHALIDTGECMAGIIAAFLNDPADAPDTTCIPGAVRLFAVP